MNGVPTLTPTPTPTPVIAVVPPTVPPTQGFAPIGERTEAPTLDVTPTFVTAVADAPTPVVTFLPPTVPPDGIIPTPNLPALPPPTAVVALPDAPPAPPAVVLPGSNPLQAFVISTSNGFNGELVNMPGGTVTIARSPINSNHVGLVDQRGLLFLYTDFASGQGGRFLGSPFSEPEPQQADLNQARIAQIAYSPDGRYLAFLVDTDGDENGANDSSNDGVWVVAIDPATGAQVGGAFILLRDCPPEPGCLIVNRPDAPYRYRSLRFQWSPSSDALLVELDLPEEGRRGVAIVYPANGEGQSQTRVPVLRYDYAAWSNDGSRLIVSGRAPDGQVVFGSVGREGGDPQLTAASAIGLGWIQDATQRPNGQIVFLGSASGPGGPLRLYSASGAALTADIGATAPIRVTWSPDRSAALVVTMDNGVPTYYAVFAATGEIRNLSPQIAGAVAVDWVP
jgi:hypothetical protein